MDENLEIPNERSTNKDTREYLSLMNTKVELLMRSSQVCEDETIMWIDFGGSYGIPDDYCVMSIRRNK